MQLLGNILYLTFDEVLGLNLVKSNYLWKALSIKSKCWQSIKDPADRRRVLIKYDSLRQKYKDAINEKYGNPYHYAKNQLQGTQLSLVENKVARLVCNDKQAELVSFLADNDLLVPASTINAICWAAAWFDFLNDITKPSQAKDYGYNTKALLIEACISYWQLKENALLNKISNATYLKRKLSAYKKQGITSLLSGKYGNKNRQKIEGEAANYLLQMASQPTKFNFVQIHALYSIQAQQMGWQPLDESTIAKWLTKPENKQLYYAKRHGIKPFRNKYELPLSRRRVSKPHALWVMDGSPMELYYRGDKKPERVYCFMVVDAHSWAVVGAAFGKTETQALVFDAIRDAARRTGVIAQQLLFDNASAIKAHDMMDWYKASFDYAFPAQVGNARAKMVEPLMKHFNEQVLKLYANYSGAGITAKRIDNRLNDEFAKANWRNFPNKEAVIDQLTNALFNEWNNRLMPKHGKSPMQMLEQGNNDARQLSMLDMINVFWKYRMQGQNKRTYTYNQNGITMQLSGKEYKYEVRNSNDMPDHNFWRHNSFKKFFIKYDPDDLSMVALYDKQGRQVAMAQEKWLAPHAVADYQEGDNARLRAILTNRKDYEKSLQREADELDLNPMYQMEDDFKLMIPIKGKVKDKSNELEGELKSRSIFGTYAEEKLIPVSINQ